MLGLNDPADEYQPCLSGLNPEFEGSRVSEIRARATQIPSPAADAVFDHVRVDGDMSLKTGSLACETAAGLNSKSIDLSGRGWQAELVRPRGGPRWSVVSLTFLLYQPVVAVRSSVVTELAPVTEAE